MIRPWSEIRTRVEAQNPLFTLKTRTLVSPRTGKEHDFYVLEAGGWVNIIPLTPKGEVVMVRQFRHATGEITLEIPGGLIEEGQSPEQAAARELLEETGCSCSSLSLLGRIRPNPAILDNWCHLFLAQGVIETADRELDEAEDLEVVRVGLDRVPEMIARGEIDHSLVVAAFFYYFMTGQAKRA